MGYIGNQTSNSYSSMDKQVITGNGGASYTLTHAVANAQEIEVFVNNVRQEAGVAYTVADNALTMTGNVASTDDFYVIYQGKALQTVVPPDGSVTNAKIDTMAATKLTGTISNLRFPSGSVVQIQYDQLTTGTYQAITADTYVKLTSFPNVTITPTSTSSKMKIDVMWNGEFDNYNNTWNSVFVLYRDSTLIKGNTDTGYVSTGMFASKASTSLTDNDSTPESMNGTYFDEPNTTSAITYYLGIFAAHGNNIFINRVVNGATTSGYERMISNMVVTEIAG